MRVAGDRLAIDGLVVDDDCAVRVVRDREQAGEDPAKTVRDAVEIGARVLDREQAAANAEYVKTEFERFGDWVARIKEQVAKASDTLDKADMRARQMRRVLKGVEALPESQA